MLSRQIHLKAERLAEVRRSIQAETPQIDLINQLHEFAGSLEISKGGMGLRSLQKATRTRLPEQLGLL